MPSDTYILTISEAGVSVPSSHASTHISGGSDVIPTATSSASGLMSAAIFNQHVTNTAKVSNATHTGDVTDASGVLTVNRINGVALSSFPNNTVLKTTTGGILAAATANDYPTLNQSTTGNANTATLATTATNIAGGAVGAVPYQTGSGTTALLSAGTAGYVLKSNGSAAPSWAQVNLSSETTGTLPVSSGGSGAVTFTAGVLKANGTSSFTTVAAPTGDLVGTSDIQTLTNKTFGSGTTFSSAIGVANGGTGSTTFTSGIVTASGTNPFNTISAPAGTIVGTSDAQTLTNKTLTSPTITGGTITDAAITGGTISGLASPFSVGVGGTGITSYAIGDILFAGTSTTLSKLADVATGNALISGGIGVAPSYGKIGLTTHVSGTLPVANGGTGVTDASTGSGGVVLSTSPTLVTPILGTPTSGTLTSCTGLPISGLVGSTSTALGVGSIELGHATDTTISRVSAGRIAVEGINVVTASSTDTLTNKTLVTPILGTPTSGTLTSCTGLPLTTGVTGILPVANGGTGVTQSAYGECYMSSGVTATTIATTGDFVKVAGTTTAGTFLSNFTHPDTNRLTYTGTATRKFLVTTALSFHGNASNDYKFAFHKNASSLLSASIVSSTGAGAGDLAHVSCQTIVELATNDFIEVFVTNADDTNSATIDFMNVTAVAII